jgi:ribosomal protein S18 acetylase RimI-like enzyme
MIQVRQAYIDDISIIQELAQIAFIPTYLPFIPKVHVEYMYQMMYNDAALNTQMTERGDIFFLLIQNQIPMGYMSVQLNANEVHEAKLHKLYLNPEAKGKGLGKHMLIHAEQFCIHHNQKALLLNVNRNNSAVDFYLKSDFQIIFEEDIDIGAGFYMNDYQMKKIL